MRPSKLHFQEYRYMPHAGYGLIIKQDKLYAYHSILVNNDEPQAVVLNGIRMMPKKVLYKAIEELSSGMLTKVMDQDLYGGYWEE